MKGKKTFSRRECLSILKYNGFVYERSTGDHNIYKRGKETLSITANKINPMIFRRLMKEFNLKEVY